MKIVISLFILLFLFGACHEKSDVSSMSEINWKTKAVAKEDIKGLETIEHATSYLSVYSQVFNVEESRTQALTVTVSIRNTSQTDTVYVSSAKYYNTLGELIRVYFDYPISLLPLETDHIIINHTDNAGGTGANFIFEWCKKSDTTDPIFEAVMLSTYAQQGISFTTHGVKL